MARQHATTSPVLELVERIRADIRQRKLKPGDPYLNTADAARRFRAGGGTVNRALQILTQRGELDRRQRRGTVIAEPTEAGAEPRMRRVRLLVHEGYLRTEGLLGDGLLVGLQRKLPRAEIEFHFLPMADEEESAERAIEAALRARAPEGFVLVRSSVGTQRRFQASGLPTVVVGTLQPSIERLPHIDRDQGQIGTLLTEHLLSVGCQRIIVLMRERLTAGDHRLLDAVLATIARHGVRADAIALRCVPHDPRAIAATVRELLSHAADRIGFLCRSEPHARGVESVANDRPRRRRSNVAIALADFYAQPAHAPAFPYVESTLEPEQWGERIASMLIRIAGGPTPGGSADEMQEVVPVRLRVPDSAR